MYTSIPPGWYSHLDTPPPLHLPSSPMSLPSPAPPAGVSRLWWATQLQLSGHPPPPLLRTHCTGHMVLTLQWLDLHWVTQYWPCRANFTWTGPHGLDPARAYLTYTGSRGINPAGTHLTWQWVIIDSCSGLLTCTGLHSIDTCRCFLTHWFTWYWSMQTLAWPPWIAR